MDNGHYINMLARIESINAEIEAAKLDNSIRIAQTDHPISESELNYPPKWFIEKAAELQNLANEPYKY